MTNTKFALTILAVVLISLAATGLHYHQSPPVRPVVLVYHDSALLPNQSHHSSDRLWTMAVRSDGATMQTNSVPDAAGHIQSVKSIDLPDRHVVVDPYTLSTVSYKAFKPILKGTRDCGGSVQPPILNHPVEYVHEVKKSKTGPSTWDRERWVALDLNCVVLREHVTTIDKNSMHTEFFREAL